MYLSYVTIENFRCFGEGAKKFQMTLRPGITALVGVNDAGKTAVIDALRIALGTTDQEWFRVEDTDFYYGTEKAREIRIVCKFDGLSGGDKRAFIEHLTYDQAAGSQPALYIQWTAKDSGERLKGRPYRQVEVHSGKNGDGPVFAQEVRELLRATYLRPLRDAEQALCAGRGSRLAQILHHNDYVKTTGNRYAPALLAQEKIETKALRDLCVLGIGDLANALLGEQRGVLRTREEIDQHLKELFFAGDVLQSNIKVNGATASEDARLRQLLEKLDLSLGGKGRLGLGSNNLLFMACELLLLAREEVGNKLLMIEEPEAHLHAQRQLRVMKYMQEQAREKGIQIIITTHSPNLASAINLDSMVMLSNGRAFSMAKGETALANSDYRFLERFLDVTKANLFFARGVMIVEGDAENILLPTLADILGRNFTQHGVSIVNVGGVGLRRYARILQRRDPEDGSLEIPVACVTDLDVMPDCAPVIIGKVREADSWPGKTERRWRAKRDIGADKALATLRTEIAAKANGQAIKTFVADEWTLEYSLALGPRNAQGGFPGGLAEDVHVAACLAKQDERINEQAVKAEDVAERARTEFGELAAAAAAREGCAPQEVLASHVYAAFAGDGVSKAVAAQYLSERLYDRYRAGHLTPAQLRALLPQYLVAAIEHVTPSNAAVVEGGDAE